MPSRHEHRLSVDTLRCAIRLSVSPTLPHACESDCSESPLSDARFQTRRQTIAAAAGISRRLHSLLGATRFLADRLYEPIARMAVIVNSVLEL